MKKALLWLFGSTDLIYNLEAFVVESLLEAGKKMFWSPPAGSQFHCLRCCLNHGTAHTWNSSQSGVPTKCSRCNNAFHHKIPVNATREMFIEHGCVKCAEIWNGYREEKIPIATIRDLQSRWDKMLLVVYMKAKDIHDQEVASARVAKKSPPRFSISDPRIDPKPLEAKISRYLDELELRFYKGEVVAASEFILLKNQSAAIENQVSEK